MPLNRDSGGGISEGWIRYSVSAVLKSVECQKQNQFCDNMSPAPPSTFLPSSSLPPTRASKGGSQRFREDFTITKKATTRAFFWLKLPICAFTFKAIPTMRRRQRLCVIFGNLRLKLYCREQNSTQWEHYTTILTFKYFCDYVPNIPSLQVSSEDCECLDIASALTDTREIA